jgi:hypothetical protein
LASMDDMGARIGMLVVETIAKIRRAYFVQQKPIKAICRELGLSRKVVRKVLRSEATEFRYTRSTQPLPKIGPWRDELGGLLATNEGKAPRERLTLIRSSRPFVGLATTAATTRSGATPRSGLGGAGWRRRKLTCR